MRMQSTRNKILKAAKEEFLENGYRGSSMRSIAQRCGLTTGAIYGVFASKDEVYATIVDEGVANLMDVINIEGDEELEQREDETLSENIRRRAAESTKRLLRVFLENEQALEIALFQSERTKHEELLENVLDIFFQRNLKYYRKVLGEPDRTHLVLIKNLTESYVMSILNVRNENFTVKEWITYTDRLIEFYIRGWIGVFEKR